MSVSKGDSLSPSLRVDADGRVKVEKALWYEIERMAAMIRDMAHTIDEVLTDVRDMEPMIREKGEEKI